MIQIENVEVFGWKAAIRGMRNAMNSWSKSDSVFEASVSASNKIRAFSPCMEIGPNDLDLMKRLCSKGGADHRKFLRMIHVQLDITAPLYWWKEFETYRAGVIPNPMHVEMNSCSTMHTLMKRPFVYEDFSCDYLDDEGLIPTREYSTENMMASTIHNLNMLRELYLETKKKHFWYKIIQLLPSSYNQRRTFDLNYEVLRNMYHARNAHKLDEWRAFCEWVKTLPYAAELIVGDSNA